MRHDMVTFVIPSDLDFAKLVLLLLPASVEKILAT